MRLYRNNSIWRMASAALFAFEVTVIGLLASGLLTASRLYAEDVEPTNCQVYFGTYTNGTSEGIYVSRLDIASGRLSTPELAGEAVNPSFVALHPSGDYLYCVSEVSSVNGQKGGAVIAFSRDANTGKLTKLNQQLSGGGAPCHLIVDPTGKNVLVANYSGGSVAVLPVLEDGSLGPISSFVQHSGSSVDAARQKGPHAHSINVDPNNRFAVAADLGLDKILIYQFDPANHKITPNTPPFVSVKAGAGPRHFAFHPKGNFAYVINEMHLTVTAFSFDSAQGSLTELSTVSTLPTGVKKIGSTAEVQVHPSGRFLYGSNRGHDSIAVFKIDQRNGSLTRVENESTEGQTPRNFGIDPSGTFLLAANQKTNNVVVFRIDPESGKLSPTGHQVDVGNPVCVKMIAAGSR